MELTELETTSLPFKQNKTKQTKNTIQWEKEECCEKGGKKGKLPENFPIFILPRRGPQN